jgi:histidinol phosphatase-like PHP family hydrolase
VLAVPEIGNSAANAAAQADFVILSMHHKAQFSAQTRDWIERWSGLITDHRSALVALLDQPGIKGGKVASALDYLRKVADRKGISFYTHTIFDLSTN